MTNTATNPLTIRQENALRSYEKTVYVGEVKIGRFWRTRNDDWIIAPIIPTMEGNEQHVLTTYLNQQVDDERHAALLLLIESGYRLDTLRDEVNAELSRLTNLLYDIDTRIEVVDQAENPFDKEVL